MQLMRLSEVPIRQGDRVFRHSPERAVFAVGCVGIAIAGLLVLGWQRGSGLAYYLAGVLLVGMLVMRRFVSARFRPSNWLLRMGGEGVFLQFRSYLNCHFPESDHTVVFIPYREIRAIRRVDERSEIPYRDLDRPFVERSTERRRCLVEFELSGDTSLFAKALDDERARRPPGATLYRDYPARFSSPGCVRVEWNVAPGAQAFLDAMGHRTAIAAATEKRQDYVDLAGLGREEQEARLRELVDAGQTIDAIYVARKLYACDLAQARDFVERLGSGRGGR